MYLQEYNRVCLLCRFMLYYALTSFRAFLLVCVHSFSHAPTSGDILSTILSRIPRSFKPIERLTDRDCRSLTSLNDPIRST